MPPAPRLRYRHLSSSTVRRASPRQSSPVSYELEASLTMLLCYSYVIPTSVMRPPPEERCRALSKCHPALLEDFLSDILQVSHLFKPRVLYIYIFAFLLFQVSTPAGMPSRDEMSLSSGHEGNYPFGGEEKPVAYVTVRSMKLKALESSRKLRV